MPAANRLGRNFQIQPKWAPSIKHRKRNCHLSRLRTLPTVSSHQGALTAAHNPWPDITEYSDSPQTSSGMAKAGAGWAENCPAPGTGCSSGPDFPPENLSGIYFWLYPSCSLIPSASCYQPLDLSVVLVPALLFNVALKGVQLMYLRSRTVLYQNSTTYRIII